MLCFFVLRWKSDNILKTKEIVLTLTSFILFYIVLNLLPVEQNAFVVVLCQSMFGVVCLDRVGEFDLNSITSTHDKTCSPFRPTISRCCHGSLHTPIYKNKYNGEYTLTKFVA